MRVSDELRRRTKDIGSAVIRCYVGLPRTRDEVSTIGRQMLRAGTSVAAHVREASRARSDAEFCSKLDVTLQEADECQLWIEYLLEDCHITNTQLPEIHREIGEIIAIFTTIVSKLRQKNI